MVAILAKRQNPVVVVPHSLVQPNAGKPTPIEFLRHLRDSEKEQLKVGMWHISCYAIRAEVAA